MIGNAGEASSDAGNMSESGALTAMNGLSVTTTDRAVAESIECYLAQVSDLLTRAPVQALERVIHRLEEARLKGQQVFTCGNGGSAATAIHFASDLAKGALAADKPPIKAQSLCDNIALLTALANDVSYDDIFTQRMTPWIKAGDVLIAISGSGNSQNVLNAVAMATRVGATTVGFTGGDGGRLSNMVDICVAASSHSIQQIEDAHLLFCHLITTCLRKMPLNGA